VKANLKKLTVTFCGRIPSKKSSQRVTKFGKKKRGIRPSEAFDKWEKRTLTELLLSGVPKNKIVAEEIIVTFYFPCKRRADLTNKAESVFDTIVKYGTLKDDSWQCTGAITLIPVYRKNDGGAVMEIFYRGEEDV